MRTLMNELMSWTSNFQPKYFFQSPTAISNSQWSMNFLLRTFEDDLGSLSDTRYLSLTIDSYIPRWASSKFLCKTSSELDYLRGQNFSVKLEIRQNQRENFKSVNFPRTESKLPWFPWSDDWRALPSTGRDKCKSRSLWIILINKLAHLMPFWPLKAP